MTKPPLAALDPQVVRPRDLQDRYANPPVEARRLSRRGDLLHLAHGYYAVVPEALRGTGWRPPVEAVALGIAQRDAGREDAALMGVSAARVLGAVSRALGRAVVAVTGQRPTIDTVVGAVEFVTRSVARLDVQRVETELATGWTTTPEQTVLDLADRPELGGLGRADVREAVVALARGLDWDRVTRLARDQRKSPAATRAAWLAGAPPPPRPRRRVNPLGFTSPGGSDPADYGIEPC